MLAGVLSIACAPQSMVVNHRSCRPLYGRNRAAARTPNENERRAAQALFAPKPSAAEQAVNSVPPELVGAATTPKPPRAVIPTAHVARICTWVKYGMTIAQVAAIYGVDAGEIARLLGKG
jgi:hypothetical protein